MGVKLVTVKEFGGPLRRRSAALNVGNRRWGENMVVGTVEHELLQLDLARRRTDGGERHAVCGERGHSTFTTGAKLSVKIPEFAARYSV